MPGFDAIGRLALGEAPATTATFMTAAAGAFTLTGIAAVFKVTMPETVGTYALTGIADAFRVTMAEAAGAYTETGPATLFQINFASVVGAYIFTGQGAAFVVGAVPAAAGSYLLTGQAVTFFLDRRAITDTDILLLPVDCVLAGQQTIKDRYRTWEIPAYKRTEKFAGTRSGVGEISNYGGRKGALRHAFNE